MIGKPRRILEAILADVPSKYVTHEVLTTLMAKVSFIVNARPLEPVSNDPDAPEVLTPATLSEPRRKWQNASRNLQEGDLVLLRCKDAPRNDWALARITKAQADQDGKVRKVELVTAKEGCMRHYQRLVTEAILLKAED
ncbi:hypothetical protein P5673_030072 [Acropora cervicornis]|uniref:DUF5641 domain-containing protein n=1 Tax=Acropora cervicornis TaxID=6130 RepID=A0AAD9PUM2_ACRCE|nr:hypothetical protein P5673_030072 [Acropora cervicornis]